MDIKKLKDFYKNKRVFVTGHTGFKGTWLCLILNYLGANVIGYSLKQTLYDNFDFYKAINLKKKIKSYYGDILNKNRLLTIIKTNKPQIFFHLAAQSLVIKSYLDPKTTFETNVIGTANVLDVCRDQKYLRSLIIVTSDKCYLNLEQKKSFKEDSPLGGNDPYSCSKAMAERLVKIYFNRVYKKTSIGLATVRAGNVIGGGDFSENRIIPDVIKHILNKKKLTLRNPNYYRPWQHVFDLLSGYLNLGIKLSKNKNRFSGPYNFGPKIKKSYTVLKLTQKFLDKIIKKKYEIEFNKSNLFEADFLDINSSKSKTKLKWETKYSGSKMIEKTIDWYKVYINEPSKIEQFSKKQILDYFSYKIN